MLDRMKMVKDDKLHIVLYLRFLQNDINVLVRTNQDNIKLCELRQKRDEILSFIRVA